MASELASIVQSTHIQHEPDPEHDINPSTAASEKIPAVMVPGDDLSPSDQEHILDDASETSTIPSDIIVPRPRQPPGRHHLPLPDLRFEQTYLASIKSADTNWKVAYITIRDQVLLPLVQGVGYHMLIFGWRHWNRGSKFVGQTLGAKVRRWWWEVNGWKKPKDAKPIRERFAREAKDFYVGTFGSATGD
ncbi:hypothetical protein H2198_007072 [Neophaeococcomyces mojaviensis]|uniref:Uncharacterized protein n=1 Tax=Neophaeococcomyces mojaviensis TaxID=3383035 RepID=A0ACC3A187_9EURO|nr:hypothetical protein H2198_007072 [Knufia sp. JES_112]